MRSSRSLLFSRLNIFQPVFREKVLQHYGHLYGLLWTCSKSSSSFLHWGPQAWTQYSRCGPTRAEQRGTITSLTLLATPLLMQPRIKLAFWARSALCWLCQTFHHWNPHVQCVAALHPSIPHLLYHILKLLDNTALVASTYTFSIYGAF